MPVETKNICWEKIFLETKIAKETSLLSLMTLKIIFVLCKLIVITTPKKQKIYLVSIKINNSKLRN